MIIRRRRGRPGEAPANSAPAPPPSGAITALVDSACGYAALTLFPPDRDVLTVEFAVSLVAPAGQPEFVAAGSVLRSGRTLTTCRGEVFGVTLDGGRKLVAVMQATMMAVSMMSD